MPAGMVGSNWGTPMEAAVPRTQLPLGTAHGKHRVGAVASPAGSGKRPAWQDIVINSWIPGRGGSARC